MKNPKKYFPVRLSIPVLIMLMSGMSKGQTSAPFSKGPVTFTGSGRALEEVLFQVQQAFQYPIYYEELPLQSPAELKAVQGKNNEKRWVSPVSSLSVTFDADDTTPYLAVQTVMGAYSQAGYPGTYSVVQRSNRIDVVPSVVRDVGGSMQKVTPILSIPVTFPVAKRTVVDTCELIIQLAATATGHKFEQIGCPFPHFRTVELGANAEAIGDVLERFSAALGPSLSFSFRWTPSDNTYFFDFSSTWKPVAPTGGKAVVPGRQISPTQGPKDSPFFIKSK